VEQEGKFVKQSGGRGQFGHVWLKIEPNEAGKGYEFIDAIKGGVVPREYIPAVDKGLRDAVPAACWPVSRWLMSSSRCLTAPTTTLTRTKMPSDGCFDGVQGRHEESQPDAARADDGG
jgi:hypothetical protein